MWSRAFHGAAVATAAGELAARLAEEAAAQLLALAGLVVAAEEEVVHRERLRYPEEGRSDLRRRAIGPVHDLVWCRKLGQGAVTELAERPIDPAAMLVRGRARIAVVQELVTRPAAPAVSVIGRVLVIVLELATNPEREIALVSAIGRVQELVIALELATDLGSEIVLVRETDPDLKIDPARAIVLGLATGPAAAVVIVRELVIDPVLEIDPAAAIGPASAIGQELVTDLVSAIGQVVETGLVSVIDQVLEIGLGAVIGPALVIVRELAIGPAVVIVLELVTGRVSVIGLGLATGPVLEIGLGAAIVLALAIGRISTGRQTRALTDRFGAIGPTVTGTTAGGGVGTIRGIAGGIVVAGR